MYKCPFYAEIHQITKVYNWLELELDAIYYIFYLSELANIVYQIVHVTFRLTTPS